MPAMGRGAAAAAAGVSVQAACVREEQSSGTNGGQFTSGSWVTRVLNTEHFDPDGLVSLSSNQITLQPGKYVVEWQAPACQVNAHQTRLYDVTGSAVVEYGSSEYTGATDGVSTISYGYALIDISAANVYKLEHRCNTTRATYGLGVAGSFGGIEVYSNVNFYRIDDAS